MAEAEPLEMAYISEVILKKRKHKEESIALTRKTQLELGQHGGRKRKVEDIKRPEQLVREFRDRVKYSTCCELVLFQNLLFL
jgi:large subunit ribosomal protein L7e